MTLSYWHLAHNQQEFQAEFCHSCINFDPAQGDFTMKGKPTDLNQCHYFYTDAAGKCWNYQDRQQPRPEPLIKDEYSVQDFIELREKSLQLSVYAELKRRGIARDEAKDIVRTAFDTDKNGWDETLSDATKNALVQVKLPLHPPDKQGPPESPSMPDS